MTKKAVDPLVTFCLNFPPSRDVTGPCSASVAKESTWPSVEGLSFGDLISARTYRNTLEVFRLLASGRGQHLAKSMMDFYGARKEPTEYCRLLAVCLLRCSPRLVEPPLEVVVAQLEESIGAWKVRALEAAGRVHE